MEGGSLNWIFCFFQSFFGRTWNKTSDIPECKNDRKCVINEKTRTSCKACRLRKCLSVGMSKSRSLYGRRPNGFKLKRMIQRVMDEQCFGTSRTTLPYGCKASQDHNTAIPGHLQTRDQFLGKSQVNECIDHKFKKRKFDGPKQDRSCYSNSVGSSSRDVEKALPGPQIFPQPPSSKQPPSPSSQNSNFTVSRTRVSMPLVGTISPPASAHLSPHQPTSPRFPVIMPVLAPVNYNPLYVDQSQFVGTGRDHLLCSPAAARVAVEQDQPIDLSVQARTCVIDRATPLDLTKKRSSEVPQFEEISA
jgi:hypothetical protein